MNGKEKMDFLVKNFKGISETRAEKIINTFPEVDNLRYLADRNDFAERLSGVIPSNIIKSFKEQLDSINAQGNEIKQMVDCGFTYMDAFLICSDEQRKKQFASTPYKYAHDNNIAFAACDKYIHCIHWQAPPDMDAERMVYFIDAMLLCLEQSGHTFAYMQQLVKKMNSYQAVHSYNPAEYKISTLFAYIFNGNDLFKIETGNYVEQSKIYRLETAALEDDIAYHIDRLAINHKLYKDATFESKGLKYDAVQLSAIESANMSGIKIITGPPGSGKTAVINGIIQFYQSLNPHANVVLCAPTGRAAKHMSEITNKPAATIHKLLGLRGENTFTNKEKLECDLLICDEASMLNLTTTYELLSHINTGTVVYFVGDKDQLPAVGPGNVLHDMINSKKVPTFHLTKVYRQDGIILNNAHKINKGIIPTEFSDKYTSTVFDNEEELKTKTIELFQKLYNQQEPFETQIIIPSYKTACGIIAINKAIQELNPEGYVYVPHDGKGYAYKRFDKILMIKNDKDMQYQNGSVGIFLNVYGSEIEVDFEGQIVKLPMTAINDMALGYAISVHKSQGSEYKHVIMCLPQEPQTILKRNVFYTGVTRAKEDIAILAMNGTIEKAVSTNMELFKQTGLKNKIVKIKNSLNNKR